MEHVALTLYAAVLRAVGMPDWSKPQEVDLFTRALLLWNHEAAHGKSTD